MKKWLIAPLFISLFAAAAGGEHHGSGGIPGYVYWQAANLIVIAIGMYFLLGKKAVSFFVGKRTEFLISAEKSQKIREEAENKVKDIQSRLQKLEATSAESIERARAESAELKKQLLNEAQVLAARTKAEATEVARTETLRAQRELHYEVAAEAVRIAKEVLKKDTSQSDQIKLQERFAREFEGVKL